MSEDHDDLPDPFSDREGFGIELLLTLTETLERAVGAEEAGGYVSVVAHRLGSRLSDRLRAEANGAALGPERVAAALVDLKQRIGGGFRLVSCRDGRIELRNCRCPFGAAVAGRPSLCRMTSGVFGRVAADNFGTATVELKKTIARGDEGCRVVITLDPEAADLSPDAAEYYARQGLGA